MHLSEGIRRTLVSANFRTVDCCGQSPFFNSSSHASVSILLVRWPAADRLWHTKRVSRLIAKAKAPFSNSTPNAALPVLLVHRQTSDQFWYTEAPKEVVFEGFLFIAARKADTPAIAAELKSLTSSPYQYRGRSAAQFEAMLKGRGTPVSHQTYLQTT